MLNNGLKNAHTPNLISFIAKWHHDRNLIDGATDSTQSVKLLEEFIELYEAVNGHLSPSNLVDNLEHDIDCLLEGGRIKVDRDADKKLELKDAIGDMMVVLINIAERNGYTIQDCLDCAYSEIKDREGKMIDGMFVKEEDLIANPANQLSDDIDNYPYEMPDDIAP